LVVIAVLASGAQGGTSSLNHVFRLLANRYAGTSYQGGWFGRPSVRFNHRETKATVDVVTGGQGNHAAFTRVLLNWPDKGFRCEVFPTGTWARFGRFVGMQEIQIGSPGFDRDYVITSNNEKGVAHLLSPGVQTQVNRIRMLAGGADVYASVNRGTFLVKKRGVLREYAALERFVAEVLDLYDQAVLTQTKGIRFEDSGFTEPTVDGAICQICGEPVDNEIAICGECHTPHHLDCWLYYGSCSTYGCQESRFVRRHS